MVPGREWYWGGHMVGPAEHVHQCRWEAGWISGMLPDFPSAAHDQSYSAECYKRPAGSRPQAAAAAADSRQQAAGSRAAE